VPKHDVMYSSQAGLPSRIHNWKELECFEQMRVFQQDKELPGGTVTHPSSASSPELASLNFQASVPHQRFARRTTATRC